MAAPSCWRPQAGVRAMNKHGCARQTAAVYLAMLHCTLPLELPPPNLLIALPGTQSTACTTFTVHLAMFALNLAWLPSPAHAQRTTWRSYSRPQPCVFGSLMLDFCLLSSVSFFFRSYRSSGIPPYPDAPMLANDKIIKRMAAPSAASLAAPLPGAPAWWRYPCRQAPAPAL